MTDRKEQVPVGREDPKNATPEAYHVTLQDATAWAIGEIAKPTPAVKWLTSIPMFLRDKTPDEQKLLERIVMLEAGIRRLVNQADLGRPDLLDFYVRTIAAELGVK